MSSDEAPSSVTFHATIPDIMSAIMMPGNPASAARIKLDIPAVDSDALLLLKYYATGRPLLVTIEILAPGALDDAVLARAARIAGEPEDEDGDVED